MMVNGKDIAYGNMGQLGQHKVAKGRLCQAHAVQDTCKLLGLMFD